MYRDRRTELDWWRRPSVATHLPRAVKRGDFVRKGYDVTPPLAAPRRDKESYRWFATGRGRDGRELQPSAADFRPCLPLRPGVPGSGLPSA